MSDSCHSRMMVVRAYPRETQEMVFDAHERAFAFFKGACGRGVYDNMKTAAETIFLGKDRQYNRRFLQMCSHHLVEPVACTPAVGMGEGPGREPGRPRPRTLLHAAAAIQVATTNSTPGFSTNAVPGRTRMPIPSGPIRRSGKSSRRSGRSSFRIAAVSMGSTRCRPRCRRPVWYGSTTTNTRSASAVGRPVDIHAYADRIVVRQSGWTSRWPSTRGVLRPRQERSTIPGITCRFWRASRALCAMERRSRTGCCRAALDRVRRKLAGSHDGDRQMVKILAAVLTDGLPAVEAACVQAASPRASIRPMSSSTFWRASAIRASLEPITTPASLRLLHAPTADCARYDQLRSA